MDLSPDSIIAGGAFSLIFGFFAKEIWPFLKSEIQARRAFTEHRQAENERLSNVIADGLIRLESASRTVAENQAALTGSIETKLGMLINTQTALLAILGDPNALKMIREQQKRATDEIMGV